jgi:hypothetical protein
MPTRAGVSLSGVIWREVADRDQGHRFRNPYGPSGEPIPTFHLTGVRDRGGRSGGEVLCRGCVGEKDSRRSVAAGPTPGGAMVRPYQRSILNTADRTGAGAWGKPWPREQDGPEQGESRRGPAGAGAVGCAAECRKTSRFESDSWCNRLAFDVTSRPQLARAVEGARTPTARSTQKTPANPCFARPGDGEVISTQTVEENCDWMLYRKC